MLVGSLVIMWPALAAPLNADQRYMYLNVPGRVQGDWLEIVRILWSEIPGRAEQGRMTPVGYFMQWLFYNGATELSVATGTPLIVLHGIQKVLIFAVAVMGVAAFVKSLRGRATDGQLVAPTRATVWLVVGGVVVLGAAGVQTHLQFRNGWLSYPVLTYGAVIVGFGVVALTLTLTRRLAERTTSAVRLSRSRRWFSSGSSSTCRTSSTTSRSQLHCSHCFFSLIPPRTDDVDGASPSS
jgi:hypothetical protein